MTYQETVKLMQFYGIIDKDFYEVDDMDQLIEAQAKHIEKLQAKLATYGWVPVATKVREG